MLLEGIAMCGSIPRAADAMDMPERQARALVAQLNALFASPIVQVQDSKVDVLTDLGTQLLDQLRSVDATVNTAAASQMATIQATFR
ncbi:MAG: hypothetical protein ABL907_04945 [Hyphomicrobium sp.]